MSRVIGRSVRRADGADKVRGAARYTVDRVEHGMLHAKLLRADGVACARIVRLDVSAALALPGVHAVLTAADVPGRTGMFIDDETVLADGIVRYAGEPVAAVAAETPELARAAVAAIELELEPLPFVDDPERALEPGAPLVHPDWASYEGLEGWPREGNLLTRSELVRGDVDAAFARDDVVVIEDELRVPRQHQSYIEPQAAVASYANGRFTIHSSTQFPYMIRDRSAAILGVRPSAVRVVADTVGGGFGGKLDVGPEPIAAALARRTGRPVRLVYTRSEEFVAATMRENAVVRIRSAVTREGEIVGRVADAVMDAGAYAGETAYGGMALAFASAYRIPAERYTCRIAYTHTPPTGAFRGICGPYLVLAVEQHMDRIARELGLDRRQLRMRHAYRDGDTYPNGVRIDDAAFAEAFERLEQVAPWRPSRGAPARARDAREPLRGVGIAVASWLTNPLAGSATVKVNEDGTVGLVTAATDIGTGAVAAGLVQLVAEELGVAPDQVIVNQPDTDAAPYDAGAQGSRTLYNAGNAVLRATANVRERMLALAADRLEAAPEDLELVDGRAVVRGAPAHGVEVGELAQLALADGGPLAATGSSVSPRAQLDPAPGCVGQAREFWFNAPTFHVHQAEVEVCPATGRVTIVRYVVAQDVGKAINPNAIEGQIHGAVAQGIGYALYENIRIDAGVVLERDLEAYRIPGALDLPRIESILLEHPHPDGPFGAKGVAEPPIVVAPAAVACAVADAIGRPLGQLPITPFDVLAALRGHDGGGAAAAERAR